MLKLGAFFALVAAVAVLAFVLFVWPTRWRYDHMTVDGNIVVVRINRMNGLADMLVPDEGWVPVEAPVDSTGGAVPTGI